MYTRPLSSTSLMYLASESSAVDTTFSTSAAVCDDSKLISRGLLAIPMRMSTQKDYGMPTRPIRRFSVGRTDTVATARYGGAHECRAVPGGRAVASGTGASGCQSGGRGGHL